MIVKATIGFISTRRDVTEPTAAYFGTLTYLAILRACS